MSPLLNFTINLLMFNFEISLKTNDSKSHFFVQRDTVRRKIPEDPGDT
jgi:hypothetical protein